MSSISPTMSAYRSASRGFTLIEVMIVVAIIAILSAIAYPSYMEQVARGRRSDGKASLLEAAQWMERRYTMQNTYVGATPPTPRSSTTQYYTLSVMSGASAPTASTYWLQIAPTGSMTSDRCGAFQVNQAGRRLHTGTAPIQDCWDR